MNRNKKTSNTEIIFYFSGVPNDNETFICLRNNYLKSREADDCIQTFVLLVRNALQVSVGVASL